MFVLCLQYPLYSAALALYNGTLLPYYLDEEHQWALRLDECKSQVDKVTSMGTAQEGCAHARVACVQHCHSASLTFQHQLLMACAVACGVWLILWGKDQL